MPCFLIWRGTNKKGSQPGAFFNSVIRRLAVDRLIRDRALGGSVHHDRTVFKGRADEVDTALAVDDAAGFYGLATEFAEFGYGAT